MTLVNTTYVIPLTTIYRQRVLPAPGKLLVRQGQKVGPQDVVAEANIASEHILLDIIRGLRVAPNKVDDYIDRIVGEQVVEGDVIATGPKGLFQRTVRAPCDGKIVLIRKGMVLLQRSETPFELTAGYAGVITELIPDRGVIVELQGSLIQGVWGNGKVEFGMMQVVAKAPNTLLKLDQVDVSFRGGILVGGHLDLVETLEALAEIPVRGLVLASMSADLIDAASQMPFPIMLTEGFGRLPMNQAAFRLLSTNSGREISLNGEEYDNDNGIRPEVIIPLPVSGKPAPPILPRELGPGQRIRVVRAPYATRVGTIQMLNPEPIVFSGGVSADTAEVVLDSGEQVLVPLANLEVLEYK